MALAAWSRFAFRPERTPIPSIGRDPDRARILIANRIGPMVHRALRAADDAVGDEFARLVHADAREAAERALLAIAELRDVAEALDAAGTPWLLWKGPALAVQVWGDPARRHATDLDVVVAPADRSAARDALARAGWRSRDGLSLAQERAIFTGAGALPLVRRSEGPLVELHSAFGARLYPAPLAIADVLGRAERVSVGGVEVRTPAGADALLLLALHATKHGWSQAEEVLSFGQLAERDPAAFQAAHARAAASGVAEAIHLAVHLARALVGAAIAPELLAATAGGRASGRSRAARVAGCLARMEAGDAGWRETHAWTLGWIGRPRDRLTYLVRAALDPTPQEWRWARLADPYVGLYPAVRLARLALRTIGLRR